MLRIKTTKEILDHLWIFKLVLWLTIDEGYSNGYVQPQYSPDQTSAYGQWNCRNFIFLWMSFQRVDPATMADPPPSGSPQESTSPEVRSQQCYVGKVTLLLTQINGGKGGRTRLPVPQPDKVNLNLWSYLKQCIGKELTKITMPVHWNEPISLLQRITEYMNYASLLRWLILIVPFLILDNAQKCTNPSWSNAEATAGVRLLYIYQYLPHSWLVWSVKVVGC